METIIVFIDDADYAIRLLQPMLPTSSQTPTRWVLVGCAPRLTRNVSKWVSQSACTHWQQDWADEAFQRVKSQLLQPHSTQDLVHTHLAPIPQSLCDLTEELKKQYGASRVLDARRPKLGHDMQPVMAGQAQDDRRMSGYAAALAGAGLLTGFD